MNVKILLYSFGDLLRIIGILMLFPGMVAAYYREPEGVVAFAFTSIIALGLSSLLRRHGEMGDLSIKNGFALVAFGWLIAAMIGAMPYILLGMGPTDSLFESMSGFTTTGASVLTESNSDGYWIIDGELANRSIAFVVAGSVEYLLWTTTNTTVSAMLPEQPTYYGLLFWRSFSQWLGGMGIILLFVAILPRLGVAGRQLYRAEVPGPDKESLTPRIRQTAELLWGIYLSLSIIEVVLLKVAGMPLYDAICTTFTTMATGGFSPQSISIEAYGSALIEYIVVLFMFLAGANFALHYKTIYQDRMSLIRDPEFRLYSFIVIISTLFIAATAGMLIPVQDRIRYALFQVVSIMTTTGFSTTNFDTWSPAAKIVLLLLMFVGACAGSTGGAIKVVRLLLMLKYVQRELMFAIHPKAVIQVKLHDTAIREEIVRSTLSFFGIYMLTFALASVMLAAVSYSDQAMNLEAIVSAVASCLGNVGPGFGPVGPYMNYSAIHPVGKLILILCMWMGRLEIMTVLVLLLPDFWKK
ncbi:MAG: TrkH family potassium uptake protein [Methanothrix sp.]|uniref:TrkH family potassium uptake protein n=1 Tax=Methanothrix sp. TaxID=90426 RepID=UPI0025E2429C|nr:TrkH family potassium uptake protein [Methanothrix sp.]MCQ8903206.1 TrkH family potassium uptake protein [Methanothrix sp.]